MKGPLNNQIISLIPILLATIISSPELQWSRSSPALVDALPIRSDTVVTDLLSDLFRQTIYTRIENLLLDPGRKSQEKQKIIDSAVDNYHKQKMIMPEDQEAPSTLADLTGFWIHGPDEIVPDDKQEIEIEGPVLLASIQGDFESTSNENTEAFELVTKEQDIIEDSTTPLDDNYHTESYHLEDLFDGKTPVQTNKHDSKNVSQNLQDSS